MHIVFERNSGFLALSPKPPGGAKLAVAMAAFRSNGVTTVVSLLEDQEAEALLLSGEAAACEAQGLHFHHYPITDFGVPSDDLSFSTLVRIVSQRIEAGEGVLVHCRGGIGRSGLFAVSVMLNFDHQLDLAIQQCSRLRGISVPETAEQFSWLKR